MYGYNEYVPLRTDEILKRTTEEEIFKIVIQEDIVEDKGALYKAPYRNDNNPDCYFIRYNGSLKFVDWANTDGDPCGIHCFRFIEKCYNVSFRDALQIINNKLGLGLGDNLGKAKKIIHEHGIVEEKIVKKVFKERVITILPRQFSYKDKQFWSNYEISKQNLIEDGVVPIELFQSTNRNGEYFSIRPFDICYAYTEFANDKKKIYRPKASKKEKWFTNCNQDDVGSISHLPNKGDLLVISKSYKDCRVIRNQGINSVWFQNEGMIPNKNIISNLGNRFKRIVIWFDNDATGITNSRIVMNYINNITDSNKATTIMLPPKLIKENIKDGSDLLKYKGKESLQEFLKKHNLYES